MADIPLIESNESTEPSYDTSTDMVHDPSLDVPTALPFSQGHGSQRLSFTNTRG
jgi:hypothetical protein